MALWTPNLTQRVGPRYLTIADALADDVAGGRLRGGTRLPTQRELARRLSVTVGTVSRAYAEAERRGLVSGEVGRGTFVKAMTPTPTGAARKAPRRAGQMINLAVNRPLIGPHEQEFAAALAALSKRADLGPFLTYQADAGMPAHRAAGAKWIATSGVETTSARVVVTAGGQHALLVTLAALTRPGDVILTESLTFPGLKAAANLLHLTVQGVIMDEHGLLPESLELACWSSRANLLYCMPTLHNPTTATMPDERRRDIVEIARRYDLAIIEDDVNGAQADHRPTPLAQLAPERVYFVTSLAKCVAPGLRVGFVSGPDGKTDRLAAGVRATTWMASPLMAQIAATWIEDGTAGRLIEWQRREAGARQRLAAEILTGLTYSTNSTGYHIWLRLPAPWRAEEFVTLARRRRVAVTAADAFVAGRGGAPQAVRISLGSCENPDDLREGLSLLARLLDSAPEPRSPVV